MAKSKNNDENTDRPKVMRTFFIYTDQDEALEEIAAARGKKIPKADLVREALEDFIKKESKKKKAVNE